MSLRRLFYSKKFLFLNLIIFGIIVGFVIATVIFTFSANSSPLRYVDDPRINLTRNTNLSSVEESEELQQSFRRIAQLVLPVVVQVDVIEIKKGVQESTVPEDNDFPFLPWNFGPSEPDAYPPNEHEFRSEGIGSGVIVKRQGATVYILTNNHVIGAADEILVTLHDDREFPAQLVGRDSRKDLALLSFKTRDTSIPVAAIGDSNSLYVGDWVMAIGNPFGYESTVTVGIVSAIGRRGPLNNINDFIQTDAAINQGNSGGALVNIHGELVGINTWITTPTGGNIGLGFAIPINNAKKAIEDFIHFGEVKYGWLGVSIADLLPSIASHLHLEDEQGAFVYHVFLDSPADRGGILPGDFIINIDNETIENADALVRKVGDIPAGTSTNVHIIRSGERIDVDVEIGQRREANVISSQNKNLWPGFTVVPTDKTIDAGVVVQTVEQQTKLEVAGIRTGDVIVKINNQPVGTILDFYRLINSDETHEFQFHFKRDHRDYTITVKK